MNPIDLEALTLEFLAIESISGNEAEYATRVEKTLRELGYDVRRQEVEPNRFNVLANVDAKSVLLCTHLDTVPPYFPPSSDAEFIYGRGACDTKGILVAMLAAGERLRADGIDDFGLLLVVGEEVNGAGAKVANETIRCEHVIVGEPTENKLALGHKGLLKFNLLASGVTGHSAYPETGHSAIHELLETLAKVRALDWGQDETLGPGTFNVGHIEGGHAANVIADAARARCMARIVGDPEPLVAAVADTLGPHSSVEWIATSPPSHTVIVPDLPTCVVNFSTDIPYMPDVGSPLLYGPGSIRHAHTANERIAKASLHQAIDDYTSMVRQLLER